MLLSFIHLFDQNYYMFNIKHKTFVFALTLTTLTALKTQAQLIPDDDHVIKPTYHIGIKGGMNMFQVNGSQFTNGFQSGFDAGVFGEINVTPQWGVQPEILYSQTGFKTSSTFTTSIQNGVNNYSGKMNYLSIPILITYTPITWLSVQAGPQYSILLTNDKNVLQGTGTAFKNGDFSFVFGLQGNVKRLKVGVRYVVGVTDLNGLPKSYTEDLATWSRVGFQGYLGFRIF
jgi:outer membrane protein with beta-barrel domain